MRLPLLGRSRKPTTAPMMIATNGKPISRSMRTCPPWVRMIAAPSPTSRPLRAPRPASTMRRCMRFRSSIGFPPGQPMCRPSAHVTPRPRLRSTPVSGHRRFRRCCERYTSRPRIACLAGAFLDQCATGFVAQSADGGSRRLGSEWHTPGTVRCVYDVKSRWRRTT